MSECPDCTPYAPCPSHYQWPTEPVCDNCGCCLDDHDLVEADNGGERYRCPSDERIALESWLHEHPGRTAADYLEQVIFGQPPRRVIA